MERSLRRRAGVPRRRGAEADLRLRPALLLALLCGCTARAQAPAGDDGAAPARPEPPRPVLVQLSSQPLPPDPLAALGLTGAEKPNGVQYRLRRSVPPETPAFVPRAADSLSLWIADPTPEGWLAFYRGPLGTRPRDGNAPFRAALYAPDGTRRWEVELNRFLSRPDHLEIQDVRLHGGRLYFNEGCQSYAREAGGECSALVRLDPAAGRVEWRTRARVSNDVFLLHDGLVVAGYGFTAEPDSLFLVRQATGEVVARHPLDSAHDYLEVRDGRLAVLTTARAYWFRIGSRE